MRLSGRLTTLNLLKCNIFRFGISSQVAQRGDVPTAMRLLIFFVMEPREVGRSELERENAMAGRAGSHMSLFRPAFCALFPGLLAGLKSISPVVFSIGI